MVKSIMIQGTSSGVGKTILTLALCRIFKEDGHRVCPFKPQNITENTCYTSSGDEIAISQWLQAKAAGVDPTAHMNPVVLKPSPQGMQAIVKGKSIKTPDFSNSTQLRKQLRPVIVDSYAHISSKYDIVVIEGAGSPVELNLNKNDIVNMGMAEIAKSPVILVADVDRGGVFASLFGTVNLFTESERVYCKASIVNRFMGEPRLFSEGVAILEEITKLPVVGVVPRIKIDLPEEDGLRSEVNEDSSYEKQFSLISDTVRKSLNMNMVYEILEKGV